MLIVQVQLALDRVVDVVESGATVEVDYAANLRRTLRADRKTKNTMRHGARSLDAARRG